MSAVNSRFPSLNNLLESALFTFRRFPFVLLSAILGSVVGVRLVELSSDNARVPVNTHDVGVEQNLLLVLSLGIPLFFALATWAEKHSWNLSKSLGLRAIGALALVAYYFILPDDPTATLLTGVRHALLGIGLHFLVAFLPFTARDETSAFWQFNKTLFLRFLIAGLYSSTLYAGLSIALAAADYLFGVNVEGERYFELWITIVGVFHTWFFLSGIPKDLKSLSAETEYPSGLKAFSQYVLLPLVSLYFVILFAYEAKIIATMSWPKGWVSQLVLWYSVVGILSLLLLHPLRALSGHRWIQVFSKWFFRALVPLIGMLLLAIFRRISDYGFTENRYFVLAMAVGLSVVVLYFIISKIKDIRIIPVVICVIAFGSCFGPWGAFSVSLNSQSDRLDGMLVESGLLLDGELQEVSGLSIAVRGELSSVIDYLYDSRGSEPFSRWFSDSLLSEFDTDTVSLPQRRIATAMGYEYLQMRYGASVNGRNDEYFRIGRNESEVFEIGDYGLLIEYQASGSAVIIDAFSVGGDSLFLKYDDTSGNFSMYISKSVRDSANIIHVNIADSLQDMIRGYSPRVARIEGGPAVSERTLLIHVDEFESKLIFQYLNGRKNDTSIVIDGFTANIFLRSPIE